MHPLIQIGPLTVLSYAVMLAASFVLGILLAVHRGRARGLPDGLILDTALVVLPSAMVGSRLLYVLVDSPVPGWRQLVALQGGGLSMYGGVVAALGASWLFCRWRGVSFLGLADVCAPSGALGLGLTRIGCFLNGCCHGTPTALAIGVRFPPPSPAAAVYGDAALHPTQLYSSLTGFTILAVLLALDRRPRPEGQLFAVFLVLDSGGRFVLDFFRYYDPGVRSVGGLTTSQIACVGLFALGIVLLRTARAARAA